MRVRKNRTLHTNNRTTQHRTSNSSKTNKTGSNNFFQLLTKKDCKSLEKLKNAQAKMAPPRVVAQVTPPRCAVIFDGGLYHQPFSLCASIKCSTHLRPKKVSLL
mmetsp:Transcript_28408/g.69149  ORF Transcript_28408/g.69149 Transcript_28408/m.69149 type:complete len:104 (+) Transcript_28408:777-1088(+)